VTKAPGYLLRIRRGQLDAGEFTDRVAEGRRLLDAGAVTEAQRELREALNLWTGPPLSNVTLGSRLEAWAVHLEEQRLRALELRIETDIRLGRHRELVCDLRSLVVTHPLHEWFHAQLIWALSASGRRSEALQAYRTLRGILSEQLGLEPSPDVQRLHQDVLAARTPEMYRLTPVG
jgi:DNA-binding SARP family transcriptional activator